MSTVTSFKPVLVQPQALADLFSAVQAQVHLASGVALDDVRITHVAPLNLAGAGAFAFLSNAKLRAQLLDCQASVIALSEADYEWLQTQRHLTAHRPRLPFAVSRMLCMRWWRNAVTCLKRHNQAKFTRRR